MLDTFLNKYNAITGDAMTAVCESSFESVKQDYSLYTVQTVLGCVFGTAGCP